MKHLVHLVARQLFLLALCSFVGIASAQNVDATDTEEILNIAKGFGSAALTKSDSGAPRIKGRISGTSYEVVFYGCRNNERCRSLQLYAAWEVSREIALEKINEWNKGKRFGRAYLDKDGDPFLEFDIEMEYGMSRRNLEECFKNWELLLEEFKKNVVTPHRNI
jgi:hypothetical protein